VRNHTTNGREATAIKPSHQNGPEERCIMANENASPKAGDGGRLASSFSAAANIGDVLSAVLDIYVVTRGVFLCSKGNVCELSNISPPSSCGTVPSWTPKASPRSTKSRRADLQETRTTKSPDNLEQAGIHSKCWSIHQSDVSKNLTLVYEKVGPLLIAQSYHAGTRSAKSLLH
jgi:hypothetical protein